jgi:hypothetical protein
MTDDTITYRRCELYEEVWKQPARTVARRYGVSDVALGNICRRLRVPLPGLGHWARIRAGQEIPRLPLPPLPDGAPGEIVTQKWRRRESPIAGPAAGPAEPPIVVPAELHNPHKLVSEASRLLRGRKSDEGLIHCWNTRCLDITVAPDSLVRALRIMHALIRALEKKGLQVEVTRPLSYEERCRPGEGDTPDNTTRVQVYGEWINFGITEKRAVTRPPAPEPPKGLKGSELESWLLRNQPRTELVPNGSLELSIKNGVYLGVRTLWHDGKRKRVEGSLNDFIAHLYIMADAIKRHRDELERARRARQEEEVRRYEEELRRRDEAERTKRFEETLHCWRLARDVREYVAEVRGLVGHGDSSDAQDSSLRESLQWAETYANRIDPLTPMREKKSRAQAEPTMAALQDALAEPNEALAE